MRHHIHELINRQQAVLPQIQRLAVTGVHQFVDAHHAIVDITERARLFAVT